MQDHFAWLCLSIALICLFFLAMPGPAVAGSAFRVLRLWFNARSHSRHVIDLAVRLRQRHDTNRKVMIHPTYWVGVELDTMPERHFLDICTAYRDLTASGTPHDQAIARLELWRSRFGAANPSLACASLREYLRYRMELEFPGYGKLAPRFFSLLERLFLRHARYSAKLREQRAQDLEVHLKRKLYRILIDGHDLSFEAGGVVNSIGWTDLERYLESDTLAVRVLSGDEVWSYSTGQAAGLALVRNERVVNFQELGDFRKKPVRRQPRSQR